MQNPALYSYLDRWEEKKIKKEESKKKKTHSLPLLQYTQWGKAEAGVRMITLPGYVCACNTEEKKAPKQVGAFAGVQVLGGPRAASIAPKPRRSLRRRNQSLIYIN